MSNFYLSINAVHRPADIGMDANNRRQFSVNFEAVARAPITSWEEDIITILTNAGLATPGTDTWYGTAAVFPGSGPGPFTRVIGTSGSSPTITHNSDIYESLTVQIIIVASTLDAARSHALDIYYALNNLWDLTV